MRLSGPADGAGGLGRSDHLCWAFDDRSTFVTAGLDFLRGGLATGQRLMYVSDRADSGMREDLRALEGVEQMVSSGVLALVTLGDIYDLEAPLVPEDQLAAYSLQLEQAIADGFTGLRVLAEVTDLVREAERLEAHVRFEHLADEFMASHPVSALCAYDVGAVGEATAGDIAAVHPLVHGPPSLSPFRAFFGDDNRLTLAGELDSFASDRLERLLAGSHLRRRSQVVLDVGGLGFIDGRGLHTLVRFGRSVADSGGLVRITGASELTRKIWRTLRFDEVAGVELVGEAA